MRWRAAMLSGAWLDNLMFARLPRLWERRWRPNGVADVGKSQLSSRIFTSERAGLVRRIGAQDLERAKVAARRALVNEFEFFGYGPLALSEPIQYQSDPLSGQSWPDQHGLLVDYRHALTGDPKLIWELNRLQHLPLMASIGVSLGQPDLLRAAIATGVDWAVRNPVTRGIPWANGYEAGLRAISLAFVIDAGRGRPEIAQDDLRVLARSTAQHVRFIERYPSLHSSANNHRVGELVGVIAVTTLVPESPRADERLRSAVAELELRSAELVCQDGSNAEQAYTYGLHVVDLLAIAVAVLRASGELVPQRLLDALQRSADFISQVVGEDGCEPMFGDDDEGRALSFDASRKRDSAQVAASLGAVLGHAGARRVATCLDAQALWLFGSEGAARFEGTRASGAPGSVYLQQAGLAIVRRGELAVTMDIGGLGMPPLAAHGHADALQVTASRDGRILIGDPGTGSYFARPHVRMALRSTRAHATVTVDGRDQSESGGPFLWHRHFEVTPRRVDVNAGVVVADHDGYRRLPDPVRHRRTLVVLDHRVFLVVDQFIALKPHTYSQRWPLAPDIVANSEDGMIVGRRLDDGPVIGIAAAASHELLVALVRGDHPAGGGLWSRGFERVEPSTLVCADVCAPTATIAAAFATGSAAAEMLSLRLEGADSEDISLMLEVGRRKHELTLDAASGRFTQVTTAREPAGKS
jgi:hypothetical protein